MTFDRIKRRWRALFRRDELERELDAELRFHLERDAAQNLQSSMDSQDAHYTALRSFGGIEQAKEECRDARGVRLLEEFWQDLRYGGRSLRNDPGFTAIAVLTLALGIGANTAIYSVVNAVLLRPLPYASAETLVWIWGNNNKLGVNQGYLSNADIFEFQQHSSYLESIAAWTTLPVNLIEETSSERLEGILVSPSFFSCLGVRIDVGRDFLPQEAQSGQNQVIIISDALWHRRFGADPNVIGKRLTLDRKDVKNFMVVGIAPPEVQFPARTDVWIPDIDISSNEERGGHDLRAVARLKRGATSEQAQSELNIIAQSLEQQYPATNDGWRISLTSVRDVVLGTAYKTFWLLLGAVNCVFLIACVNVAGLQLARSASRSREIVLRVALGAGRIRIIRQLLTESLLLASLGGASGLLLAWFGVYGLKIIGPNNISRLAAARVNGRVLVYTGLVILVAGITCGCFLALQTSRFDLNGALRYGPRGSTGSAGRSRIRSILVLTQVAVATLLLVGTGLLLKSFLHLQGVDPGFRADHVLTAGISLNRDKYMNPDDRRTIFFSQVVEHIRMVPGVESVGMISHMPFGGRGVNMGFTLQGHQAVSGDDTSRAELRVISSEYFRTMNIPLRSGRTFTEQDTKAAPRVVIINEAFVRQFFPDIVPIGRRLQVAFSSPFDGEIVGVVGDVRHRGYDADPRPELYISYLQNTVWPVMNLVIRTQGEPRGVAAQVRREIEALDPTQAIFNVRPFEEMLSDTIADRRFNLILLLTFALVAAMTAASGIYATMTYFVTQQIPELGIRMALGARSRDVLKLILAVGMKLTVCGVSIGLLAALVVGRLMTTLLFGVTPTDVTTFTTVSILLLGLASIACYIPARRATKVDPLMALKYE